MPSKGSSPAPASPKPATPSGSKTPTTPSGSGNKVTSGIADKKKMSSGDRALLRQRTYGGTNGTATTNPTYDSPMDDAEREGEEESQPHSVSTAELETTHYENGFKISGYGSDSYTIYEPNHQTVTLANGVKCSLEKHVSIDIQKYGDGGATLRSQLLNGTAFAHQIMASNATGRVENHTIYQDLKTSRSIEVDVARAHNFAVDWAVGARGYINDTLSKGTESEFHYGEQASKIHAKALAEAGVKCSKPDVVLSAGDLESLALMSIGKQKPKTPEQR